MKRTFIFLTKPIFFLHQKKKKSKTKKKVKEIACFAVVECWRSSRDNLDILYSTPGGILTMIQLLSSNDPLCKSAASECLSFFFGT